jgi:hypothetical protein
MMTLAAPPVLPQERVKPCLLGHADRVMRLPSPQQRQLLTRLPSTWSERWLVVEAATTITRLLSQTDWP